MTSGVPSIRSRVSRYLFWLSLILLGITLAYWAQANAYGVDYRSSIFRNDRYAPFEEASHFGFSWLLDKQSVLVLYNPTPPGDPPATNDEMAGRILREGTESHQQYRSFLSFGWFVVLVATSSIEPQLVFQVFTVPLITLAMLFAAWPCFIGLRWMALEVWKVLRSPVEPAPAAAIESAHCLRCQYDLRGMADDQPCPECGLLAVRSRRPTHELRDARPRWLLSLSIGIWLMLFAFALAGAWLFLSEWIVKRFWASIIVNAAAPALGGPNYYLYYRYATVIRFAGEPIAALILLLGAFVFTRPEGYEPADRVDRSRRKWIRIFSCVPLLGWI